MRISEALARVPLRRPQPVPLELPKQSNPGRYGHDGSTRLINCYCEHIGREGKIEFPIYASDGLKSFATLSGGGACRGMIVADTYLLIVSGSLLFSVDSGGTATTIGGIADTGPVSMSRNRANPFEVVITTLNGLRYVVTNIINLAEITDTDLPPPNSNDNIDGYTLYGITDGRVFYSEIDDSTNIDALNYFTAEGAPDGLVKVFVFQRTIFLLGKSTIEIFDSVGDATNPFQRKPGGFLEYGCASPGSVQSLNEVFAMVDDHGTVLIVDGAGNSRRISNHAVELSIDQVSDKTTIESFVYHRRGHEMYVLSAASFTWVCDITLGARIGYENAWHERQSFGESRSRASNLAFFADKYIVGDFESGLAYELDPDTYDEAGNHLIMTMRVPVHAWPNPINLKRLRVDMIPGAGLNSTTLHVSNPQMMLRLSTNGGKSWGDERTKSIGLIGQHGAEVKFDKLGVSNEDGFVIELSVSAAVIRAITGLAAEFEIVRRGSFG